MTLTWKVLWCHSCTFISFSRSFQHHLNATWSIEQGQEFFFWWSHCLLLHLADCIAGCWGLWIWVWVFFVLLLVALAEVGLVLSSLLFWCCFEVFDGVSFFSLVICVSCLFLPFPILPTIPPAILSLCPSGFVPGVCPSCPHLHSVFTPHPPPPRPLTDPPPPSLAGTPCRTVWRKSIRQSNPESLPSGPSRERWVW